MLVKPEIKKYARIKVVGVGGGGCNTVKSMMEEQNIQGVEFMVVNTDAQDLAESPAPVKIQIGTQLTGGLGSGGNPEVGRAAAEESIEELSDRLGDADMIFITAGEGGGTGTGASPVVAEVAKSAGALTVSVVTKPFEFEGPRRMMAAEEGIRELKDKVDALITIPNDRLMEISDEQMSFLDAFKLADSILGKSVKGISDIIVVPGLVNRDFADVKSIMQNAGSALMGIASAVGDDRAIRAAREAVECPLLEASIEGAKGVLFNIAAGKDLKLSEVNAAAKVISSGVDADAQIIFGATIDETLADELRITVIATGFDEYKQRQKIVEEKQTETSSEPERLVDLPYSEDDKFDMPTFMRRQ